jgi:hypothetical protein
LAEREQKKKDTLVESIPPTPNLNETVVNENVRHLLATCIFRCDNQACRSFNKAFGFDQAMSHDCEGSVDPIETKLAFSESGSAAATNVVTVLGLDVHTALPAHLDALQTRVGCVSCINTKAKVVEWLEFV